MKTNLVLSILLAGLFVSKPSFAQAAATEAQPQTTNMIDELDPFDPNIEQTLQQMDKNYEEETGLPSHMFTFRSSDCYRESCTVWVRVEKSEQRLYLYVNGQLQTTWAVSSGVEGHGTPDFDTHPDGRIYDEYSSTKYPGGDYNGLGNMPYAVFISGGFAIHGTPQGNWSKLGTRASHGCIRVHPDNAYTFNRMVRQYGVGNVWVTVE